MERKLLLSLFFGVLCIFVTLFANAEEASIQTPIGYWKTLDDNTGKPKSIVQIWKTKDNVLMGKVIKIFSKNDKESPVCTKCTGEKLNQPIVGMVIIFGLEAKEKQWANGKILDPENGKTYSCNVRTLENGKKLHVRGFIGLPLLGRSQTWERVDLMSG